MGEEFNYLQFLKSAVAIGASDEHLKVNYPPFLRKNGEIFKTNMPALTKEQIEKFIVSIVPKTLKDTILNEYDKDFMYEIPNVSRFRINYNRQVGEAGLVIRNIPYDIAKIEDLGLPEVIRKFGEYKNGIVIVTGPTGSGKSTTLAAIIQYINTTQAKHIITIEDPIEYLYPSRKSIITQRQIGVDTASYADGIKYALRQDPDIIFIGEIRDKMTMESALKAAETGHLVFTTLHTNDAVQTINRIIDLFDESSRELIRNQLSENLRATVSQRLVYSNKDKKRYPINEIMVVTSTIKDYIIKNDMDDIYEMLETNTLDGMQSMNNSLVYWVDKGCISKEEALAASSDAQELEKLFSGVYRGTSGDFYN